MSELNADILQEEALDDAFPQWPWLTILIQPRKTIHKIVDSDPQRYVVILAILAGIANAFSQSRDVTGDSLPLSLVLLFIIGAGALGGLLGLWISGGILTWTGEWFGGKASSEYVRAAMAWSAVPAILSLFFALPALLLYQNNLFTADLTGVENNPFPYLQYVIFRFILVVWWYVLFWLCYAEVEQLSLPKAFLAIITPWAILLAVLFGCGLLLSGFS